MPDTLDAVSKGVLRGRGRAPGSAVAKAAVADLPVVQRKPLSPAIYHVDIPPDEAAGAGAGLVARAAGLGFNMLGFSKMFVDLDALEVVCDAARAAGLEVMLDVDITLAEDNSALVIDHPDWFFRSPQGVRFIYLASNDPAVSWWDGWIEGLQGAGVSAFRCLGATEVPGAVWARLIDRARRRHQGARFMAWTPGAAAEDVSKLRDCGFDFAFSSGCWWDFRKAWLDDEAARLAALAPAIALAAAPDVGWPETQMGRVRALRLAAFYAAGWMMPAGFETAAAFDLADEVMGLNQLRDAFACFHDAASARLKSSTGAAVAVLQRGGRFALLANASMTVAATVPLATIWRNLGATGLRFMGGGQMLAGEIALAPGESFLCEILAARPVVVSDRLAAACTAARIAIEKISPKVDDGQFPVRRVLGETVVVEADIFSDGHDKLAAEILWRAVDETQWRVAPMRLLVNDRWRGEFPLTRMGRHVYVVNAWKDDYATFVDEVAKKHKAGVPIKLELEEGMMLVRATAALAKAERLDKHLARLETLDDEDKRILLLSDEMVSTMRACDTKAFAEKSGEVIVDAERIGARFANWYEIFPRSQSGEATRHGTFQDVIRQLPRIAEMGFDVLYFPPIHPIGRVNRKGRNNTLTPAPDDPGSPYAIGTAEGGHNAVHPELGTIEDFHALRDAAAAKGIELALDFAIQCAPDHPWLQDHKDWFDWRPDGSLRYAENPPKKYEDIVNVDFYAKGATPGLWLALRDVVQFWVDQGVRLFRVDNPHTKPLPFWEWMIADIRGRHPDTVFLAEAFTRPKVMYRLAKIGFSQSYTYFTWRNSKAELSAYLTELNTTAPKEFFRPHFFVNTPDINPVFLHHSGRAGFLIRAALAATLSGLWGVYNGFELCESAPVAPGKEEYLDSEKYQIRVWDYERPGNIVAEITQLNRIRRGNAALHDHLGISFHNAYNDQVLYFSKTAADGNVVLVAISLDPFNTQYADIEIPLWQFGLPDDGDLAAEDLMRDFRFVWHGKYQNVTLHPEQPFCIWRIQTVASSEWT